MHLDLRADDLLLSPDGGVVLLDRVKDLVLPTTCELAAGPGTRPTRRTGPR